ncbi:MAG: hypothetical protein WC121_12690 [Candidatus Kapaibacterium sp.]
MNKFFAIITIALATSLTLFSHESTEKVDVDLHVNKSLESCSIIFDESLTQSQFDRFTDEASDITYFSSLSSAKTLGQYNFELSLEISGNQIDEKSGAWNNTFQHPDENHYLIGGDILYLPYLRAKMGVTDELDFGIYYTEDPRANYGFLGIDLKYNLGCDNDYGLDMAVRATYGTLLFVDDATINSYSVDFLVSKEFFGSLNPYVGISANVKHGTETTEKVDLDYRLTLLPRYTVGLEYNFYFVNIATEASYSNIFKSSLKLGFQF